MLYWYEIENIELGMGRLKRMTKGSGEGKVTDTKARMEQ
jgi:hypothetical protein